MQTIKTFTRVLRESLGNLFWLLCIVAALIGGAAALIRYSYHDVWQYAEYFISTAGLIIMVLILFIYIKVFFK